MATQRLFKILTETGEPYHGGRGQWHLPQGKRPGKWMPKIDNVQACERGYHLCREQELVHWLGPAIFEVEGRGEIIIAQNKIVVPEARLIRRYKTWNESTARLFAADCAESVLPLYENRFDSPAPRLAIQAARKFARGEITQEELTSAAESAWSAARAAARAAWSAWSAARAAARAAWSARAAELEKQTKRLLQYLDGEAF